VESLEAQSDPVRARPGSPELTEAHGVLRELRRGAAALPLRVEQTIQRRALLYDKNGEEHYNIISALHKSMRNSDPDASVYWLARKHLGSEHAALGFALAYLLYPPTQWLTLNEFHPVALACPLLLFAFWYLDQDRLAPFAAFGLLAATTKEEIAFVVAGLGLWYAFSHRRRLQGAVIFAAGAAAALIAIELVIPHFNRAGTSSFFTRYSEVGSTPGGIVHTAITDPWKIVTDSLRWTK